MQPNYYLTLVMFFFNTFKKSDFGFNLNFNFKLSVKLKFVILKLKLKLNPKSGKTSVKIVPSLPIIRSD